MFTVGRRKRQAELKASPYGPIQQLGMIAGRDHDYVARQLVELHQQERDDALYLPGFVRVSTLLTYRIELVEE